MSALQIKVSSIKSLILISMLLAPSLFNAVLSVINANLFPINTGMVIASELLILSYFAWFVLTQGIQFQERFIIIPILAAVFALITCSLAAGWLTLDFFRLMLIILLGYLTGRRLRVDQITLAIKALAVIVFSVLLLEMISIETYAGWFAPAEYYANTRGQDVSEFNETGLFNNALGFEGRFGYGIWSGPRTASVFLEQVSLSNFITVLMIAIITLKGSFSRYWLIFFGVLTVVALLTNEGRSSMALTLVFLAGYFVFPKIPRSLVYLIVPFVLLAGAVFLQVYTQGYSDSFNGRLYGSFIDFYELKLSDYLGLGADKIYQYYDSGYAYLIVSGTVFGFLAFMYLLISHNRLQSASADRNYWATNLFYSLNLCIGASAVFTIKIAFLVWLLAGFASVRKPN